MVLLRRVAAGIVIAAAIAILGISVYLIWYAWQWSPQAPLSYAPGLNATLEIYSRRVNEMETFIIVLLGITGLYTIALILGAELTAMRASREVERAVRNANRHIAESLSDLRGPGQEALGDLRVPATRSGEATSNLPQDPGERIPDARDFERLNELGWRALRAVPSDPQMAEGHFKASLEACPNQQRARYGLALVSKAAGDLMTAQLTLEGALAVQNWERQPDPHGAALVQYTLACVLARRGSQESGRREELFAGAIRRLQAAFSSGLDRELVQTVANDIEKDGDLFEISNSPSHAQAIDGLLLAILVGTA